jgi:hypothetical protein
MTRQKIKKLFTASAVSLSKLSWDLSKVLLVTGSAAIFIAMIADSIKIKEDGEL